jgi:hypothetical protein
VLAFGALDWAYWGVPFYSYFKYVEANLINDKSSYYGIQPVYWYFGFILVTWAWATPPILALLFRARGIRLLWIAVGLAVLLSHVAIGHKEYRFIFPATVCLIVAAALSSADLVQRYTMDASLLRRRLVLSGVVLAWVLTSASLAFNGNFRGHWFMWRGVIQAFFDLSKFDPLCGVLVADDMGYSHLHRPVPLYPLIDYCGENGLVSCSGDAFNAIIIPCGGASDAPPAFRLYRRENGVDRADTCILVREGPCAPVEELEINARMRANGQ